MKFIKRQLISIGVAAIIVTAVTILVFLPRDLLPPAGLTGPLPVKIIDQGSSSRWVAAPHAFLIDSEARWNEVWDIVHGPGTILTPRTDLPRIDFHRQTLVATFLGGANPCYGIGVREILATEDGLSVDVQYSLPPPGALCGALITHPFQIVAVDYVWREAIFHVTHVVGALGSIELGTGRARYPSGQAVDFFLTNGLDFSIHLRGGSTWTVYRDVMGSWDPIDSRTLVQENTSLDPGESHSWSWRPMVPGDGPGPVNVEPGFYRIDAFYYFSGPHVGHRVLGFFWLT